MVLSRACPSWVIPLLIPTLILFAFVAPVAFCTEFDDIPFEDLKVADYAVQAVSLEELEEGEVIFLKTAEGIYAKLQISYTRTYAAGSRVYQVSIAKGTTYASTGKLLITFANVQVPQGRSVSVRTGKSSTSGELGLSAEVPASQVTKIEYFLTAQGGAKLSRYSKGSGDATIRITHTGPPYMATVYLDSERQGYAYKNLEFVVRTKPGAYALRLTAGLYKDWEQRITIEAGEEEAISVEFKSEIKVAFSYSPTEPKALEPVHFVVAKTAGDIVKYEWDWDGDDIFDLETSKATAEHSFEAGGYCPVILRVTDSDGDTSELAETIHVERPSNAPPIAAFSYTADAPGENYSISFDSGESYDPDGEIVSWEWDFGDGQSRTAGTDRLFVYRYAESGTYRVTLTVTDRNGEKATITKNVIVPEKKNAPPTAVFNYAVLSESGAKLLIAPRIGDRILFDPSASSDPDGKIVECEWDWESDGAFDDAITSGTIEHRFLSLGDHKVTLRVTDDGGATGTLTKIVSLQNMPPTAAFTYEILSTDGAKVLTVPRVGDKVRFDPSSSSDPDGEIEKYEWDWESDGIYDNAISAGTIEHQFTSSGEHQVTLRVTDNAGATGEVEKTVSVNEVPEARFSYSPVTPREGEAISFDATKSTDPDGTIDSFEWDFGDGVTKSGSKVTHSYKVADEYTITLTVADDAGATGTLSRTISVTALMPPEASYSFTPPSPTTQDEILFEDRSEGADGHVVSWSWDFDDGDTSSEQNPIHQYKDDGSYSVVLTVTDNDGLTGEFSSEITVDNISPIAGFTSLADPKEKTPISFDASGDSSDPDGNIVEYKWDFDEDGKADAEGELVEHTFEREGIYAVTLVVRDDDGDTDSETRDIKVEPQIVRPHDKWAVIVGIGQYRYVGPDLAHTRDDAEAIYEFLVQTGGFEADHVKLLVDEEATLSALQAGLEWLQRVAIADDLVIFYFSGHGCQAKEKEDDENKDEDDEYDEFLVVHDTQRDFIKTTAFKDDNFAEFLEGMASQHILVLFDCCYAGGQSKGSRSLSTGARPTAEHLDIFDEMDLEGTVVLAASTEDQESYEFPELGHGVFTYFLLEGLSGKADANQDYNITVHELYTYINREVQAYVREKKGEAQEPQRTGKGTTGVVVSTRNRLPQAAFSWTPEMIKEGTKVTFQDDSEDQDGRITCWEWDFGDGTTSTVQNPVHSYSEQGQYAVGLTVTDDDGDETTTTDEVIVSANTPPEATFSWLPEEPFPLEKVYFFDGSSDPDGEIIGWEWDFGDRERSTAPEPTPHLYMTAGNYLVTLRVEDDSEALGTCEKELLVIETSFIKIQIAATNCYFVSFTPTDREKAKDGDPVWIYERNTSATLKKVGVVLVAEGVIQSVDEGTVEITVLHLRAPSALDFLQLEQLSP